jgi:hypothetical protein
MNFRRRHYCARAAAPEGNSNAEKVNHACEDEQNASGKDRDGHHLPIAICGDTLMTSLNRMAKALVIKRQ